MEVFSQARLQRKYWTTDIGCSGFATISAVVVVSSSTTTDNTEDDDDNSMILVAVIAGVVVVIVVLGILLYCYCRGDDKENDATAKKVPTETTMPVGIEMNTVGIEMNGQDLESPKQEVSLFNRYNRAT